MLRMRNEKNEPAEITLDDVRPQHPDAYPAKRLRETLRMRRQQLSEIGFRAPAAVYGFSY